MKDLTPAQQLATTAADVVTAREARDRIAEELCRAQRAVEQLEGEMIKLLAAGEYKGRAAGSAGAIAAGGRVWWWGAQGIEDLPLA